MWNIRILALIPVIYSAIMQIEADITGLKGPQKRAAALDLVKQTLAVVDAVTGHPIVNDETDLIAAAGSAIDAIVGFMNVAKANAAPAPAKVSHR